MHQPITKTDGMCIGVLDHSKQQSLHLEISARDYWECTDFQEATKFHIPMEEETCPSSKYSFKRRSTNLIPGEDSATQRDLLTTDTASFCLSTVIKKVHR